MSIIIRDGTNPSNLATVDSSGNLHTLDSSGGTSGAAVPATAIQVAGSDGTDLRTIATDASGQVKTLLENAVRVNGLRAALGTFSLKSTSSSPVTLIAAGTGFRDIITLIFTNEGITATIVTISDGTATYTFGLAAGEGLPINFVSTLPATTTATAWTVANSASNTVDCSGVYLND